MKALCFAGQVERRWSASGDVDRREERSGRCTGGKDIRTKERATATAQGCRHGYVDAKSISFHP